jgi:propionate CoA-transferase
MPTPLRRAGEKLVEDGAFDDGRITDHPFTTEHGPFGGVVMSSWQFSANKFS